eukprot:754693-Hanusia_phi.AAC.1
MASARGQHSRSCPPVAADLSYYPSPASVLQASSSSCLSASEARMPRPSWHDGRPGPTYSASLRLGATGRRTGTDADAETIDCRAGPARAPRPRPQLSPPLKSKLACPGQVPRVLSRTGPGRGTDPIVFQPPLRLQACCTDGYHRRHKFPQPVPATQAGLQC